MNRKEFQSRLIRFALGVAWPAGFLLAGLFLYQAALAAPFLFDDLYWMFTDPGTRDAGTLFRIIEINRPLVRLTYHWNYLWGGFDPWGYHLFNLILHCANAWLVMLLLRALLRLFAGEKLPPRLDILLAALGGVLYLAHPLMSMAVVLISTRGELLCAFFFLAGLVAFARDLERPGRWTWVWVALLYLGAILSKEIAITFPVVCLILHLAWRPDPRAVWTGSRKLYILMAIESIGLLVKVLTFPYGSTVGVATLPFNRWEYFLTQITAWVQYVSLFAWPHPARLSVDWAFPVVRRLLDPALLWAVLVLLAMAGAAVVLWRRGWVLAGLGLAFFFLTLAPTSSIIPIADAFMEYRVYLPVVGLVLALVGGPLLMLVTWPGGRRASAILRWAILAGMAGLIVWAGVALDRRLIVYRSAVDFWGDAVRKAPTKLRPRYNLAHTLAETGDWDRSLEHARAALAREPRNAAILQLIGDIHREKGAYDQAMECYEEALRIDPKAYETVNRICFLLLERGMYAEAWSYLSTYRDKMKGEGYWMNLAIYLNKTGQPRQAVGVYQDLLTRYPASTAAWANLAAIHRQLGDNREAEACFRKALYFNPDYYLAHYGLGGLYLQQGKIDEALESLLRAREANPHFSWTDYELGNYFATTRNYTVAEDYYRKFVAVNPGVADAWYRLGLVQEELGKRGDAVQSYGQSLKVNPSHQQARAALQAIENK